MTEQGKAGRPSHQPTEKDRKTVQAMASYGITQEEIAEVIGISHVTLRKHYARELKIAATMANALVAQRFYDVCVSKEKTSAVVNAQKFWLERRAGWKPISPEGAERDFVPEVLSKKAQQARDAEEAGVGTEWGDDLIPPGLAN